jgi:hypothetical protein
VQGLEVIVFVECNREFEFGHARISLGPIIKVS